LPYIGVEADHVKFEGDRTEGTGYATEMFVGAEYYFRPSWSAVLDVGSAYVAVTDDDTDEDVSGTAGVINIGFRYHFGREVSR
jgi:predicted porin